jgi:hypothetical protein
MANTFELIASSTVGSGGAASIDFSSIPSTYTDLVVKLSGRSTGGGDWEDLKISFNGSTTDAQYYWKAVYGYSGSTVGSNQGNGNSNARLQGNVSAASATANTFGTWEMYVPNYAGSTAKSVSTDFASENNSTATLLGLATNLWNQTTAINRVTIATSNGNNLAQYSTAYLYGIKNS